ncbi:MAG: LysR family transcriptional regulator [Oscillospiraceae bacterium]|nr:LysR family transcriptional regulator [Oscillospiraceae bacterium]
MTTLQIKCFVSLANTKRLTETAKLFDMSVPTLSKLVKSMEDEMVCKLFARSHSGLELTKEGSIAYSGFQFILKKCEDIPGDMSEFTNRGAAPLNVALLFHQSGILRRLTEFSDAFPDINLSITENSATNIERMLNMNSIDAALVYEEFIEKKYYHLTPVRKDALVAVVSREHPLARRGSISVGELRDDTFFLFKGDAAMHRFLIYTCVLAGFAPVESLHNLRVSTIMRYVASNLGVSLLVDNTVRQLKCDGVAVLALAEDPVLTMSLSFPVEYLSDACERLVKFFKTV